MGKPSSSCFQGLPCLSTPDVSTGILTSANGGHETRVTEALTDAPLRETGFCLQTSSPVPLLLGVGRENWRYPQCFPAKLNYGTSFCSPQTCAYGNQGSVPIHLSQLSLCLEFVMSPDTRQSARLVCYCTASASGSNRSPNKRRSSWDDKIAFRVYWMNSGRAANKSREI